MKVHVLDGTYELFRHYFAVPSHLDPDGHEVGATRGVVRSVLGMLEQGATHVGVATDHVIESWRNDLWATYKDGSGVVWELKSQFPLLEDALRALGVTVWAMVEDEADDALATAAKVAAADDDVERVLVCTPDKDLGQVVGGKIRQLDRRKNAELDAAAVRAKFGVDPASIPDYLALVGDSADGFPGLKGWGASSAAAVLARWGHLDAIPDDPTEWDVSIRNARGLAATLRNEREQALLFRTLATLQSDCDVGTVESWRWAGPGPELPAMAARLGADDVVRRTDALVRKRATQP
jgi:5'-3' exonuclease